jgi:putative nucleotidyltransferase with HDIG domain
MKRIMFVDDETAVLEGLRNVLRPLRSRWSMRFATGGEQALEALAAEPADVVVSDMRMPGMDGLALLGQVKARYPNAARIVLSGYADLSAVAAASAVAHQYLLKPCDVEALRAVIERTCGLQDVLSSESLRRTIGSMGALPSAPRMYAELTRALADPDVEVKQVAAIVKQDVGMSSRVLQFVNSAFYGLAQRITSIESAIVYLGMNTVRHLALTIEVVSSFRGAGLEDFERHAALTARIAKRLVSEGPQADVAFAAGLLHDAGKLVLANRLEGPLAEAARIAAESGRPMHEVEREVIGANHCEVGAYLLGLWALPNALVEAVAFHHQVERLREGPVDPVAAVCAANLLARTVSPGGEEAAPRNPHLLDAMARDRVAGWREIAAREAALVEA